MLGYQRSATQRILQLSTFSLILWLPSTAWPAAPVQCPLETILQPYPYELCFGHGEMETLSLTDWESGLVTWSVSHVASDPGTFDTPDWAVVADLPDLRPGKAAFVADLQSGDCAGDDESGVLRLDSPLISIPPGTIVPRIAIDHWLATEQRYDGGNFKISVNGNAFNLVPSSAIEFSPYNEILYTEQEGNTNPLAGETVFSGTDEGQTTGSWGQSLINLYGIAQGGDTIRLRFDFGIDCDKGVTGWYVDDVRVYSCSAELQPSDCGNGVLNSPQEQCDDGNTRIGDGCSNSCQIESGWQCTAPKPAGEILDPGFEAGTNNAFWTESSTNFGTPICDEANCSTGGDEGPAEGLFWAWFGGDAGGTEEASLAQTVTIPSTATGLRFELEVNACDSSADYFEVLIDGSQVYFIDGSSPMCGAACYETQSVNIQPFADGGPHDLVLHAETFATNGDVSNFFVDELSIPGMVSECSPASAHLTLIKEVLNDNGGTLGVDDFPLFINGVSTSSGVPAELTAGDYVASETNREGYAAGDWGGDCDAAGNVSLAAGDNKTCTITNDDINPIEQIFGDGFESN